MKAASAGSLPLAHEVRELLEDEFERVTGEPRVVTGLEVHIEPSGDEDINWSATCDCERQYAYAWNGIYDEAQKRFPQVLFG